MELNKRWIGDMELMQVIGRNDYGGLTRFRSLIMMCVFAGTRLVGAWSCHPRITMYCPSSVAAGPAGLDH